MRIRDVIIILLTLALFGLAGASALGLRLSRSTWTFSWS